MTPEQMGSLRQLEQIRDYWKLGQNNPHLDTLGKFFSQLSNEGLLDKAAEKLRTSLSGIEPILNVESMTEGGDMVPIAELILPMHRIAENQDLNVAIAALGMQPAASILWGSEDMIGGVQCFVRRGHEAAPKKTLTQPLTNGSSMQDVATVWEIRQDNPGITYLQAARKQGYLSNISVFSTEENGAHIPVALLNVDLYKSLRGRITSDLMQRMMELGFRENSNPLTTFTAGDRVSQQLTMARRG